MDILADPERVLKGLCFQDLEMQRRYNAYPEMISVDATYRLLEIRMPVYLILNEDAMGETEIVAVSFLAEENAEGAGFFIDSFKKHNPNSSAVRVVMADKDIQERDVIKQRFNGAHVLICLFHTMRSFKREVSCEKMGISPGQKLLSLEILQKLAYSKNEEEYDTLYEQLVEDAPPTVVDYFNENWHPIRDEWVMGMKFEVGNFLNTTNNRLESLNAKLKSVITRYSSLEEFLDKFYVILNALRTERDHTAAFMMQKRRVVPYRKDSPENKYCDFLTTYAADYVCKQLALHKKVSTPVIKSDGSYEIQTFEGLLTVFPDSCCCNFYSSMCLPCRHLFALRSLLSLPLFVPDLCDIRWTSHYYKANCRMISRAPESHSSLSIQSVEKAKVLSQHQKFRKANILARKLATLASEVARYHFDRRIEILENLVKVWKDGKEAAIVELTEQQSEAHEAVNGQQSEVQETVNEQQSEAHDAVNGQQSEVQETVNEQQSEAHDVVNGQQSEVHETVNEQQLETHESDETVSGQQVHYYM